MQSFAQQARDIQAARVERARRMSPADKLLAGQRLFERACEITKAGIRHQHPDADEEEVRRLLRERLAMQRRMEANQIANRRRSLDGH